MKKLFLPLLMFMSSLSFGQLLDVVAEVHDLTYGGQPEGTVTYRLYAEMQNPTDQISAMFGILNCHPMEITTSTTFYNDANFGGLTATDINPVLFPVFPTIEADSWLTIGAQDGGNPGDGSVFSAWTSPLDPITPSFGVMDGGDFLVDDGAIFATLDQNLTLPVGPDNRILLGQFTTSGTLCYKINLQVFVEGDYDQRADYVHGALCDNGGVPTGYEVEAAFLDGCIGACGDPVACNYNPDVIEYNPEDCEYNSCGGCTDPAFCNYDPLATLDDGSCTDVCPGCSDEEALNYNENATVDDGSCVYAGCTDPFASNYDGTAVADDGSCIYQGCTDNAAWNYNPLATMDDGSCEYDCDGQIIAVVMYDSGYDGWESAVYVIYDGETPIAFGNLENAQFSDGISFGYNQHCLPAGNYTIEVEGGNNPNEIITAIECVQEGQINIDGAGTETFTVVEGVDCIAGCTDPNADNYDPAATFEVACLYYGCTNPLADNFDPNANADDDSCIYELDGFVFYDANQNGVFDNLLDYGLQGEEVVLEPGGMIAITNADGHFTFGEVPPGQYTITHTDNPAFPINVTPNSINLNMENPEVIPDIPFALADGAAISSIGVNYLTFQGTPCNGDPEFNWITVFNNGNTTLTGYVAFEFDPLYQGLDTEFSTPDSIVDNIAYYGFDNLLGGSSFVLFPILNGPGVEYIGEFVTNNVQVYALEGEELVAYGEESNTSEVTCAYDPNDKQAIPAGYTDQHFILNETTIDYTIRFQNTGNAPANLVTLRDTIATEFDLSTIQVVSQSHSMMTCIDPASREVVFMFDDIQLPDSASAPEESIGFVTFRITPLPDLAPGTVLENTAHIFFDSNPAIVTNTYQHRIYECGAEGEFSVGTEFCFGDEILAEGTHPYVEEYAWQLDGEDIGSDPTLLFFPEETGPQTLTLTGTNPLCETTTDIDILVNALPEVDITEDGPMLTATAGESYQWFLNGDPIAGANAMEYTAVENGDYSVYVVDANGCGGTSEEVNIIVISVEENDASYLLFYPNPMADQGTLVLPDNGPWNIQLVDGQGRVVTAEQSFQNARYQLNRHELSTGIYFLNVSNLKGINETLEIVIR